MLKLNPIVFKTDWKHLIQKTILLTKALKIQRFCLIDGRIHIVNLTFDVAFVICAFFNVICYLPQRQIQDFKMGVW